MSSSIDLRHLRYFLAVAETQSFTRAAERMNIAQPSISQQIKDLETAIGTSLFDRLGKSVRLTDAGHTFREHAEAVLKKMDEAYRAIDSIRGLTTGHLEVAVIPAVACSWIPAVLERFCAEHPGVTVAVREEASDDVETDVEAGRVDLGIGFVSNASPLVAYERLHGDEFVLIVPKGHPLAKETEVPVKDLAETRLALLPLHFNIRQAVMTIFQAARVRPRVALEVMSVDAALRAVDRTGAATILPSIVLAARPDLHLRGVHLKGKHTRLDLGLLWPQRAERAPAARAFGALVAEVAAKSTSVKRH